MSTFRTNPAIFNRDERRDIDAAVLDVIRASYAHWCTYPFVDGKRCKAEPVLTATRVWQCEPSIGIEPLTLARVNASLARLVKSGELETSTATIGTTEHKPGREVKVYSPAARYTLLASDGSKLLHNANGKQCDDAIAYFCLGADTVRVSTYDPIGG